VNTAATYSIQACPKCNVRYAILADKLGGWFYFNADCMISSATPRLGQTVGGEGVIEGTSDPFCIRCAGDLVVVVAQAIQTTEGDWLSVPPEARWPGLN